jgi:hypothetical protein
MKKWKNIKAFQRFIITTNKMNDALNGFYLKKYVFFVLRST